MTSDGLSAAERAAVKERAAELRAEAKRAKVADKAAADLKDVLDKIAEMVESDRVLAERVHELVLAAAPHLAPKTWYGMPAYTLHGKVVVFFKPAVKYGARTCTLGFEDRANLDAGTFWPTAYAVTGIDDKVAKEITSLVVQAAS